MPILMFAGGVIQVLVVIIVKDAISVVGTFAEIVVLVKVLVRDAPLGRRQRKLIIRGCGLLVLLS